VLLLAVLPVNVLLELPSNSKPFTLPFAVLLVMVLLELK